MQENQIVKRMLQILQLTNFCTLATLNSLANQLNSIALFKVIDSRSYLIVKWCSHKLGTHR